jgi:uncharacterized protein (TIGR02001 family)
MKQIWSGAAVLALASITMPAQAEFTGNVGWESDYVFRGVQQNDSSAQGGLDWEDKFGADDSSLGYYVGTWVAGVEEGMEIDYYGGVKGDLGNVSYLLGATLYTYNDDFDDTYKEVNLGAGWGPFSLDFAVGKYEGVLITGGGTENDPDYEVYEFKAERNGFYALVGVWSNDADGEWAELGYGWDWKGVDLGVNYTYTNDSATFDTTDDSNDNQLAVSVTYNFAVKDVWNKFQGAISQ